MFTQKLVDNEELETINNESICAQLHEQQAQDEVSFDQAKANVDEQHDTDIDTNTADITDIYLREIGAAPLLNKEQEVYYARLIAKGDMNAKNQMIKSNLRLVVKIARRYIRSGMPILDLIEEGNIGLIRAVEKFDPELGFRFSTYGAWWIQQTIERAIMSQNRTIRLPVHMAKRINACLRAAREVGKNLDHEPTAEEIAKHMQKPVAEVKKLLSLNERIVSTDVAISDEINKPLLDSLGNPEYDPIHNAIDENLKTHMTRWLAGLTTMQRIVVEKRFGLHNQEPITLEQTGIDIGVTRERVRQLQSEALKSLKSMIQSTGGNSDNLLY